MIGILIVLFIVSLWVQIYFSIKKLGYFLNPIVIFNILFFLHNWSFSFSKIFDDTLRWYTPNNGDLFQMEVLLINLTCLWGFYYGFLFSCRDYKYKVSKIYSLVVYKYLYYFFTFIVVFQSFRSLGGVYGENQASNSSEAFSPLGILLLSRTIWGAILVTSESKKRGIYVIIIELIISLLTGGRKSLIIIVFSFLLAHFEYIKVNFSLKKLVQYTIVFVALCYIVVFLAVFRESSGLIGYSYSERIFLTASEINRSVFDYFLAAINIANSEAVQIWTYELIQNNSLDQLFGLSYLQAILNTVILRPFQGDLVNYQAAYYFKSVAYPNLNSMGYDFTFTAEGILNWGNFALISYVILGIAVGKIYSRRRKSNYYNVLYILIMSILYICFRTDSTSFFRYLSFFVISFFVFKFLRILRIRYADEYFNR